MDNKWQLPLRVASPHTKKDQSIIWNTSRLCYEQKLFGQVTDLSYNASGTMLGATSTNQVAILRIPYSNEVVVNEQTGRKNFSICFRQDDKLYIQAIDQRVVVKSPDTAFERQFSGHTREVRGAIFLDKHNFVSASDDTTIKLWDLLTDEALDTAHVHTDYVRCLENYSSGCLLSGSYDHSINLWDPRAGLSKPLQSSGKILGAAVEAICFLEDSELIACGSGDQITLFDVRKGLSSFISHVSFHTKTVVSLAYSPEHKTLLSASLDCRLKMSVLMGSELKSLSTMKFNDPLTAVAMQNQGTEFAVGTATGDIRVFKLDEQRNAAEENDVFENVQKKTKDNLGVLQEKMNAVRHQLKTYHYGKAIRTALYARHADVLVSTLEELIRRGALHVALSNQNDRTVARILRFATEYVDKPHFTDTMLDVFEVIFEIYSTMVSKSNFFFREMKIAQKRVAASLATLKRMKKVVSTMELIVNVDNS
ncbi:unnamed protein product [Phytomonas sp. Hart1]|nr:unnamed protein product [Phytomonas sp. Hart1]|eukprot:CCW68234.1 unnamed protein product [Phytomonas sp. isolate Hart1]